MSTSSASLNSSKMVIFKKALRGARYFVCARILHPERMWACVSGCLLYIGNTSHLSQFADRSSLDGKLLSAASVGTALAWLRWCVWVLFSIH